MATQCSSFEVSGRLGAARAGTLTLPNGTVPTPAFMPVGTRAAVRGITPAELREAGSTLVLANTYHLWVRPGSPIIGRIGGLRRFMGWQGPILTDSGGYQVFSLREHTKVTEAGVRFRSPEDGEYRVLSPEVSIAVQEELGVDIAMAFDECLEWPATRDRAAASADRTTRWLDRCISARKMAHQTALFGIVQGGTWDDLRRDHALQIGERPLDGYAIGGLSVGEDRDALLATTEVACAALPADRPRYLMGVGQPRDLLDAIARGVDLFDCVLPTRAGRHGHAYTSVGRRNLKNARYAEDPGPLDPACACPTCTTWSLSYLRHLTRCDEMLGKRLLTLHNLWYYQSLVRRARAHIAARDGDAFAALTREAEVATALVAT